MTEGHFFSAERRGFKDLSVANWSAVRPVERRPANARQTLVFARHRNALTTQWIPAKREPRARQFLYVPLPVSTVFDRSGTPAELETFWKLLGNSRRALRKWKLSVNILETFRALTALADKRPTHPRFCLPV